MKTKRTLFITIALAFLVIGITIVHQQQPQVRAQTEIPPPVPERVSFGMVGITAGQTLRISVANTILPNDANLPPGPVRVVMTFRGMNGQLIRNRAGDVIRRTVDLERGDAAFLDLDYDALPPGPVRLQLRPVVVATPPSGDISALQDGVCIPTVEIINNANGRTQFAVFTNPAVIRGFNPQPDPPIGD
jgi:hypothetical protein